MKLFKINCSVYGCIKETIYIVASDYNKAVSFADGCGTITSVEVVADTENDSGYCRLAYAIEEKKMNIPKADLSKMEIIINKCREDAPYKSCAECICTVEECIECQKEAEKALKERE